MAKLDDLTGRRFGSLIVLKKEDNHICPSGVYVTIWRCRCDCGQEKRVMAKHLKEGVIKSCGCIQGKTTFYKGTRVALINDNVKIHKNNKSGCRGVCWNKSHDKWMAYINLAKKPYNLGLYDKLDDAIKARKAAEERLYNPVIEEYAAMIEAGE